MAGIPIDRRRILRRDAAGRGLSGAIADQVEDPDEVSGVVERAVTRIVTPGTLTESELLGGADNDYVAALTAGERSGWRYWISRPATATRPCRLGRAVADDSAGSAPPKPSSGRTSTWTGTPSSGRPVW